MTRYFNGVVCLECGHEMPSDVTIARCDHCGSPWVDAQYDYDAIRQTLPDNLRNRDYSLWRYAELLPIQQNPQISMGEGYTSLLRLYQYEDLFNHQYIYMKDERQGPTSSFKDRQAAMTVTAMQQAGITQCVLASTGNAAVAYAAYCARAGIKLWLFVPSLAPEAKMREAVLYGAEVVKVTGTYDETKKVASEFAKRKGIHMDHGAKAIPGKESMKTLGYEIAEQLGLATQGSNMFASPDWYIQAVSGGIGPLGVWKGFSELKQMGLIDKMPRLAIVQAGGCAPMVDALANGDDKATPVVPKTLITVLATGDPGFSYVQLREAVLSNNGTMIAIEDGEAFEAMRRFAAVAGVSVEPATAVAVAGLEKLLQDGTIAPNETVVMNCSGHTFPVESHILGDQYILNLKLNKDNNNQSEQPHEELNAALDNLDEQVTTILVVDDNLNDRRLIRRLLQRYKSYRIFEAQNGVDALKMIKERKPDLIVCDLTMPDMDGFTLVEQMQMSEVTANIPMIIVSAKTLSNEERAILEPRTASVWTKGGFDTRQLVEHVTQILGDTSIPASESPLKSSSVIPRSLSYSDDTENIQGLPTIVIIEDNANDMRLTQRYLSSGANYHVISTMTGRDGLKAVYTHHPDLIILDLGLPDISGFEILHTLKTNHDLCDIPVIVVSAQDLTRDETEELNKQIYAHVEKAMFNRKRFVSLVDSILVQS